MLFFSEKTPRINLSCKLVPLPYREAGVQLNKIKGTVPQYIFLCFNLAILPVDFTQERALSVTFQRSPRYE